jgi:hypothetical protein
MLNKEVFELLAVLRHTLLEQRQWKVIEIEYGDLSPGLPGAMGGDRHKLLVEQVSAETTGERQDT